MADANVYDGGCKRLREKMQCTAMADAVHCKDGCSALRERLQCTASEMSKTGTETFSPILDKRIGRRDSPHTGHCSPLDTSAEPLHHTQGDALGYVLVAPSGRALNACAYSLIQLENLE